MPYRLLFSGDNLSLAAGTALTVGGGVIASEAPIPGVEYLTPFGLLMVVLWSVGVMVRKLQADASAQTDEYITALVEQNKRETARADEMVAKTLEINKSSLECVMAFKSAIESTERAVRAHQGHVDDALDKLNATVQNIQTCVVEAQKLNTESGLAINRQLGHWAEIIQGWQTKPCVAMQTAEGRDYLARVAKAKEAE